MIKPRVYGMSTSGNCYKVRLLLEQLPLAYEWIEIDVRTGVTRQPEFAQMEQLQSDTSISAGAWISKRTRPQWQPPEWRIMAVMGLPPAAAECGSTAKFIL